MIKGQEQRSTLMPWMLRPWPLITIGILTLIGLVLLAVFVKSDVTRVAMPAIVSAIGTLALAAVTYRLSIKERGHQDELRRADEHARRLEAENEKAIKAAAENAANQRQKELEYAADLRQARRVAAFNGAEGPSGGGLADQYTYTVTIVNGSDYPIFDIGLIGARNEPLGGPINHVEWPPVMRLEGAGEPLYVAILLPSERHVFRGNWKWRKGFVLRGNTISERRATYTWKDDHGRAWQRDGNEPPKLLPRPWVWGDFWEGAEYVDQPEIQP